MTFSPLTDWMQVDDPLPGDLAVGVSSVASVEDEPVWPAGWTADWTGKDSATTEVRMHRIVDGTEAWPEWMAWEPSGRMSLVRLAFARMIPRGEGDPDVCAPRP